MIKHSFKLAQSEFVLRTNATKYSFPTVIYCVIHCLLAFFLCNYCDIDAFHKHHMAVSFRFQTKKKQKYDNCDVREREIPFSDLNGLCSQWKAKNDRQMCFFFGLVSDLTKH